MDESAEKVFGHYEFKMAELRSKCEAASQYITLVNTGSFIGAVSFYGQVYNSNLRVDITLPLYLFFVGIVLIGVVFVYEYFAYLWSARRFKEESQKQQWSKKGLKKMIENSECRGHAVIVPVTFGVASLLCWITGMVIILMRFQQIVTL